jgi:signal transduction histidine kinase
MSGSNHTTPGPESASASPTQVRVRLAGLALAAVISAVLIIGLTRATWQRVDELDSKFATLHPESFDIGVRVQSSIRHLNDTLLRFRLRKEPADNESFRAAADELKQWIENKAASETGPLEAAFLAKIETAYLEYYTNSLDILDDKPGILQSRAGAFQESYRRVEARSEDLLALCETFVENQRTAFRQCVTETNDTLAGFQQMLRGSAIFTLVLAGALVVLVYRGMIAPLRHQLSASRAIIERQEKLASLGVLAAGLAHEIRNPLTAIRFRLFSLNKALPAGDPTEDATVISGEIARLERILQDFLRFARPADPDPVPVPAQRLLQDVHDLMLEQLRRNEISLQFEPGDTLWVNVDTAQLKQVLINLVQNAADSVGSDGSITLRARTERGAVALDVSDTGKGIPPEVEKRLFDPFFTTKDAGSGLGLPIAARIVEKHGGSIRYRTQKDAGTTFTVLLPLHPDHESESAADRG